MKKILFLIFLGLFASCSCAEPNINRIFFEGHSYVYFKFINAYDDSHQVIHDPDCGCQDRWIMYAVEGTDTVEIKRIKTSYHD
jgi:hypothetical protein